MPWPILDRVRAAILYTKAGNSIDKRNYELAKLQIEEARALLGNKASRLSLFEFDLRSADIYRHTGYTELATAGVRCAKKKIVANPALSRTDKDYLLDYCDILVAEINGEAPPGETRLVAGDYPKVTKRYTRFYPVAWS